VVSPTQGIPESGTVPRHVAIIMDGNGRWARARGLPRHAGHKEGVAPVRMCVRECLRHGVEALTLFAFSSENWGRPGKKSARCWDCSWMRWIARWMSFIRTACG